MSNFILVSLDDDNILMTSKTFKEIISISPSFGNHKEKIRGLYTIINNENSQNFPNNPKKNFVFGFHKKKNSTIIKKNKKLIYSASTQEQLASEKIIEIFKDFLQINIIKRIPLEPKYSNTTKKVRNEEILCFFLNILFLYVF